MIRQNVHLNTTFYQRETAFRPNIKLSEQLAYIDLVVMLAVFGLLVTACMLIGWAL